MNIKIENILKKIVQILAIIILVFLTVISIYETADMNESEFTTYFSDNIIVHIIAIIAIIALIKLIKKRQIKISKRTICIIIAIWLILIVAWVLITQLLPRADQSTVLEIAKDLLNGKTDAFENKNYVGAYPHQTPLIFFEAITNMIFGDYNFLWLQFLNILAILVSIFAIYKITRILFKNRQTSIGTMLSLFLFAPLSFYVTFIYGNLFGLATSMVAVWFLLKYLESKKIRYIFVSAINIELAILFKSNYIITLIAMLCLIILYAIKEKRLKTMLSIILLIVMYFAGNFGINAITKAVTGKERSEGVPAKAFIAMGLQEGPRAPGWYNEYNINTYKSSKYDTKKADKKATKDLKKRIKEMVNNPGYTLDFFYKKTASQWNNPTFQCFCINEDRKFNEEFEGIFREINTDGITNKIFFNYMNIIQTLILFGATSYFILDFKNIKSKQLIFIIIFIGGFLFHLIWEAKGQYTFTYFVLLIPYAIRGLLKISDINLHKNQINDKMKKIKGSQE